MVLHVNYEELKGRLPELIEAAKRGEKIIIAQDGKQVVQITPVKSTRRKFGSAKGKIKLAKDFNAPLTDFREYMP
jgi:prevent-host-death family protein